MHSQIKCLIEQWLNQFQRCLWIVVVTNLPFWSPASVKIRGKFLKSWKYQFASLADLPISFNFFTVTKDLQTKKLALYGLLWLQFSNPFIAYEIVNSREKINILTILPYTPFGIIWGLSSHLKKPEAVKRFKDGILKRTKICREFPI